MKLNVHFVFHTPWMRTAFTAALCLIAALCMVLTVASAAFAENPDLPADIKADAAGKMVLLDFHSPYCSACQMMEPHVRRLQGKTADTLFYKKIDLTEDANSAFQKDYGITGTPTYVLFDANGKPLYRMEALISPSLLETQVLRHTGQLQPVNFPQALLKTVPATPTEGRSREDLLKNLLLVTFDSETCADCKTMAPYLAGFEMAGQEGLHILRVDADSQDGKTLLETLKIRSLPTYVLLDNSDDSKEVLQVFTKVKPKDLWSIIRLFGEDGLNGEFSLDLAE